MPSTSQHVSCQLAKRILNYRCCAIFDYGSRVYGYKVPSDHDLVVVIKHDVQRDGPDTFYDQFDWGEFNVTVMCEVRFFEQLASHEITVLECINLPAKNIQYINPLFQEKIVNRDISLSALRSAISKKSSNSYVKAKKKLIVEEDMCLETSVKSLFHSLRILQFGSQLATTGKIKNFAESNKYYVEIIKTYQDSHLNWEEIHKVFKPIYNELATEFKKNAPKQA